MVASRALRGTERTCLVLAVVMGLALGTARPVAAQDAGSQDRRGPEAVRPAPIPLTDSPLSRGSGPAGPEGSERDEIPDTLAPPPLKPAAETLDIPALEQDLYGTGWLAIGEMIFRHYNVPRRDVSVPFQCALARGLATRWPSACNEDCFQDGCIPPARSLAPVQALLARFRSPVAPMAAGQAEFFTESRASALTKAELMAEIEAGNPVIALLDPLDKPQAVADRVHLVLIAGFRRDGDMLDVNDPTPFGGWWPNPYRGFGAAQNRWGGWLIPYDIFVRELRWMDTLLIRRSRFVPPQSFALAEQEVADLPQRCCTPKGRLPIANPDEDGIAYHLGAACSVDDVVVGPADGHICR